MTKVLVTGGAGFIGSHLVDSLIEKGFDVRVIDNLVSGKIENVNPAAKFYKADICNLEMLKTLFCGIEFVFHLAALPRVQYSIANPKITHDVNVCGTLNVLLAARDMGIKRVIYSSSSSVYGNQSKIPLRETMKAMPVSPYGLQKYFGELYCNIFSQIYNLGTVSLRYFNVFGSRAPADGAYALVIGKFLEQRKKGGPLTIVPDGKQSRDFTYVSDVVRANILAAESLKVGKGEAINIGGGKNYSVMELAGIIGGPQVFIEPRLEAKHTLSSIKKAKRLLNWEPKISLEEGIKILKNQID